MTTMPVAPPRRVSAGRTMRHGLTLAWRNVAQLRHSPEKLLDVTLMPIVFLLLFLYVFGGAVAGDTHSYLQLLLPGLVAQIAMFSTMAWVRRSRRTSTRACSTGSGACRSAVRRR